MRPADPSAPRSRPSASLSPLARLLRCLECRGALALVELEPSRVPELGPDGILRCAACQREYPVVAGTARLFRDPVDAGLVTRSSSPNRGTSAARTVERRTADAFAYEWEHFGQVRAEWRKNFLEYMQPHAAGSFTGRLVLDVGAGSGRHSREAAELGAHVVAVDVGCAIDVARRNLPLRVLTVQADAEDLPFEPGMFDFVMTIGVLHHLPDPERAFRSLVQYARPGGYVHVYVYWVPARPAHRRMLRLVSAARRVTVRLPYPLLHAASYPLTAGLFAAFVLPYRLLRRFPRAARVADAFPLKAYADYPFRVCVNDQFDRFSAPIENRYTRDEVERWFQSAGLDEVTVLANNGWVASGRVRHSA